VGGMWQGGGGGGGVVQKNGAIMYQIFTRNKL